MHIIQGMRIRSLSFVLAFLCCAAAWAGAPRPLSPVGFAHLTCEYLDNPLGIDITSPRLSWVENSPEIGYRQAAYRIVVSSTPALLAARKGDLWDSGKVESDRTTLIPYRGVSLGSRMRCWWAVRAWDTRGRVSEWSTAATFSMGLLSKTDWRASWIGKDAPGPHADLAMLAGARWIWSAGVPNPSVAAPIGARYFRYVFDAGTGRGVERAVFVGSADNEFTLYVDGVKAGGGNDWSAAQGIDVTRLLHDGVNVLAIEANNAGVGPNPAGVVGALKIEYAGGVVDIIRTGARWQSCAVAPADWTAETNPERAWQPSTDIGPYGMAPWGQLIDAEVLRHPPLPARYLRREFQSAGRVKSAVAYVCGLGFFQLFVNGKPATDHVMDPALSNYRKVDYYVTVDVTSLIKNGPNAVGVVLGNGRFYAPRTTNPFETGDFGVPRLLLQLEITYADGSRKTVVSDGSWQVTDRGPIRANNEYDGEVCDARMAMPGWSAPGFLAARGIWSKAEILPAPGGVLQSQMLEPMRVTDLVRPVGISSPRPGTYIVDMGRSFYGTVRLNVTGKRGSTVRMTSAYALLPDGTLKTADNRTALSTDIYTFAGRGRETWNPVFKGQGYRRVQVTGFPGRPTVNNFEGLVEHTDVRPVGTFSCSNTLVDKIHEAMRTGMTMFLRSAPLDPDRDERQAWTGDPSKDSESEAYNFDVAAFYSKWMDDVRHSQHADGSLPDVAMYWDFGNGVEWPSVFTIIPDWFTDFYADTTLERRNYAAMKRWVLAMRRLHTQPDGTLEATSYGDWCDTYTIDGKISDFGMTPRDLISTAYQYHNVRIMQRAAERFGCVDDARMWRDMGDTLSTAFMHKFYNPAAAAYTGGTQCSFVLPLAFGLVPGAPAQRRAIVDNLVRDIEVTHDNHLTVGLIGNQWLLQVLTAYGRPDVAWKLVTQTTRPSWGYMIERGSNTIWERWDYDTRDPGMNSESLLIQAGNVDAWFYQTLAGIDYDPAKPGFSHILIRPHILGDLTWVNCSFDSPHGMIVSNWKRAGNNVTMDVTIPANTTATVTAPDGVVRELMAGHWVLKSNMNERR